MTTPHRLQFFPSGAIRPQGWLAEQLKEDLKHGYPKHYGKFDDTVTHELFGKNKVLSLGGTNYTGEGGYKREWWSGEHEGYWLDGLVRMAFLGDDLELQQSMKLAMENILAHQATNGYIGIYAEGDHPGCRFQHPGENGELWSQSCIFSAMLAYAEFSGDSRFFDAVRKAVDLSMEKYQKGHWKKEATPAGGHSHAAGFVIILDHLLRRTQDAKYGDFAKTFYADFSEHPPRDDDWVLPKLEVEEQLLLLHGAHITEGMLLPLLAAAFDPNNDRLQRAAKLVWPKLQRHITPSGAMVSYENVELTLGSAFVPWEYCTNVELLISLNRFVALSGDLDYAAAIEKLFYNALQASRPAILDSIQYLGIDHQPAIDMKLRSERHCLDAKHHAACCALNGHRALPHFVEGIWMKQSDDDIIALQLAPSRLQYSIHGQPLSIEIKTNYPFEQNIGLVIQSEYDQSCKIRLRIPLGSQPINLPPQATIKNNCIVLDQTWQGTTTLDFQLESPIRQCHSEHESSNYWVERGPLVYALPIPSQRKSKIDRGNGFHCWEILPMESTPVQDTFGFSDLQPVTRPQGDTLHPWASPPLALTTHNPQQKPVELWPMGCSILRKLSFPKKA